MHPSLSVDGEKQRQGEERVPFFYYRYSKLVEG
jgi:hypothetical protein